MNNSCLADFYHGWIIEVSQQDEGFRSVCYSPSRQRLSDYVTYASDFQALSASKRLINQHFVRHALSSLLRELYEADSLDFDEWRSLNQSLSITVLS